MGVLKEEGWWVMSYDNVVDFGGGNTVGWVDRDKYGSIKGEMQGLSKIMAALGVEANSD